MSIARLPLDLALASIPIAQSERGNITGIVADPTGGAVAANGMVIPCIDIRGEAFNLLNRTLFAAPNTNYNSNVFGQIVSQSNSPRQMQLGLKVY